MNLVYLVLVFSGNGYVSDVAVGAPMTVEQCFAVAVATSSQLRAEGSDSAFTYTCADSTRYVNEVLHENRCTLVQAGEYTCKGAPLTGGAE